MISAQNHVLPHLGADIRPAQPEPAMKATIIGFTIENEPIWARVPVARVRQRQGWAEPALPTPEKNRADRAR